LRSVIDVCDQYGLAISDYPGGYAGFFHGDGGFGCKQFAASDQVGDIQAAVFGIIEDDIADVCVERRCRRTHDQIEQPVDVNGRVDGQSDFINRRQPLDRMPEVKVLVGLFYFLDAFFQRNIEVFDLFELFLENQVHLVCFVVVRQLFFCPGKFAFVHDRRRQQYLELAGHKIEVFRKQRHFIAAGDVGCGRKITFLHALHRSDELFDRAVDIQHEEGEQSPDD
jgi:hypothetical protein